MAGSVTVYAGPDRLRDCQVVGSSNGMTALRSVTRGTYRGERKSRVCAAARAVAWRDAVIRRSRASCVRCLTRSHLVERATS
ncbi:hypothetical protein GCM10010350_69780 [Streptomyces galilaeus]|nr:hypothetical protein GCM10010350_69780 [Streptomyces galilaeus]